MSLLAVEQPGPSQKDPTALENAAKVLGIISSLGSVAGSGYNAFVTAPAAADAAAKQASALSTIASNPQAYGNVASIAFGATKPTTQYGLGVWTQQPQSQY